MWRRLLCAVLLATTPALAQVSTPTEPGADSAVSAARGELAARVRELRQKHAQEAAVARPLTLAETALLREQTARLEGQDERAERAHRLAEAALALAEARAAFAQERDLTEAARRRRADEREHVQSAKRALEQARAQQRERPPAAPGEAP
jgi:Skp family chaperone for outer membrane proteins